MILGQTIPLLEIRKREKRGQNFASEMSEAITYALTSLGKSCSPKRARRSEKWRFLLALVPVPTLCRKASDIVRLCTTPNEARRCLDHSFGRDTDPYWLEAITGLAKASTRYEQAEAAQDVSDAVRAQREAQCLW